MSELIYLASPYSDPDANVRKWRYRDAISALTELTRLGRICFSPIVHSHPIVIDQDWEFWRRIDEEFLRRCDRMIVVKLHGWEQSIGVASEIEQAKALSMPIEYMEAP